MIAKFPFKLLFVSLLFTGIVTSGISQSCYNFHKRRCEPAENALFNYNTQSKSGLFEIGYTSDMVIVVHSGQDYRISLCQDKKVTEKLKFKVLNGRTKEVMFDNEQALADQLALAAAEGEEEGGKKDKKDQEEGEPQPPQWFEFSCETTSKIIIRITAPGPPPKEEKKGKKREPDPEDLFCVGVLVENMPTPKLGF